jgi:hypothetical protein
MYTGTSCAVAIAGAVAIRLLDVYPDILPKYSSAQPMFDLLANSATDLGEPGHDSDFGWGRISAYRAFFNFKVGDANNDGSIDISDAVYITNYAFVGGEPPKPIHQVGDANCDGEVNVSDAVYVINYSVGVGNPPYACENNYPE